MRFVKMDGLGNDFIMMDCLHSNIKFEDFVPYAVRLCDRHFGIGADGLILILPSDKAELKMRILNSDGSEAEMCGNGIRCYAKYAYDHQLIDTTDLSVETGAGVLNLKLNVSDGKVQSVRVNMGEPRFKRGEIPIAGSPEEQALKVPITVGSETFYGTGINTGNPHFVIFVENTEKIPLEIWGPLIETSPLFPKKTNVEFVEVVDDKHVKMRVWERGAGITLACGTGACATTVASVLNGKTRRNITVTLPGGDLQIEWGPDNHIYMTGPAEEVFQGDIDLPL